MEFLQGKSLADCIEKEGAMLPERVAHIMEQVCGSLEEAHGRGIVHRDLKPDNVVLVERAGKKDFVKVLDFGIAKRSKEEDKNEQKLTQQGMVLGTPPYMSPEQFTGQAHRRAQRHLFAGGDELRDARPASSRSRRTRRGSGRRST